MPRINSLTLALAVWLVVLPIASTSIPTESFRLGDVRLCRNAGHGAGHNLMGILETLPGSGWDNLQNMPMGLVLAANYSLCRTTDDGRFLIPDSINVYPVKTSRVDSYAEIISSWKDYTSATSQSINADLGFQGLFDISGTFSKEYLYTKTRQMEDESITTRVQERYIRYRLVVQPDVPLDQGFKYRLLSIAASLELNDTHQARFDAQQLVREFGTHVTTSVSAGAAIIMEEQVSESITKVKGYSRSGLKSAAKFSFASQVGLFWAGVDYQTSDQRSFNSLYMQNRTDSLIRAVGGSIVNRTNVTRERWTDMIDKDLVALDRAGEPVFSFITAQTLPEVPASTLLQVAGFVEEAVRSYYKMNTHPGCTDKTAANFSPSANFDDGSCRPPDISNLKLGGLFQRCNNTKTDAGDLCEKLRQNNPKTGLASCPEGYEEVPLLAGNKTHTQVEHVCKSCWLVFGHCCHDEARTSTAHYEAFWCAAIGDDEKPGDDGYFFGGVFTSRVTNIVTSSMTCPHAFVPIKVGEDLNVCLSDEYATATENALPFAGFYSCQSGNPLALGSASNSSLVSHVYTRGPAYWPRTCPIGYSPFMADMTSREGCEVDYCIQAGALKTKKLPALRRPPFIRPPVQTPNPQNQFVFDLSQNLWQKNEQVRNNSFLERHWSMDGDKNMAAEGSCTGSTPGQLGQTNWWLVMTLITFEFILSLVVIVLIVFVSSMAWKLRKMEELAKGLSTGDRKGRCVNGAACQGRVNQVGVLLDEKVC